MVEHKLQLRGDMEPIPAAVLLQCPVRSLEIGLQDVLPRISLPKKDWQ